VRRQDVELASRAVQCCSRRQASHHVQPAVAAAAHPALRTAIGQRGKWHPDVGLDGKLQRPQPGGRHPYDAQGAPIDPDRLLQDVGIPAELALPKAVTDDGDVPRAPGFDVGSGKGATDVHRDAEQFEVVRRHGFAEHQSGLVATAQVHLEAEDVRGDVVESGDLAADVEKVGIRRDRVTPIRGAAGEHGNQRVRVFDVSRWSQEKGVDGAEDDRSGTDADGQ